MKVFYVLFDLKGPTRCQRHAVVVRSPSKENAEELVRGHYEGTNYGKYYVIVGKVRVRPIMSAYSEGPPKILQSLPAPEFHDLEENKEEGS